MIDIHKTILYAILEPILTPDEEQLHQFMAHHERTNGERPIVGEVLARALEFIEMTQALADEHWERAAGKGSDERTDTRDGDTSGAILLAGVQERR